MIYRHKNNNNAVRPLAQERISAHLAISRRMTLEGLASIISYVYNFLSITRIFGEICMSTTKIKKLHSIDEQIAQLKQERQQLEESLATDFIQVLKTTEAFQIGFSTLVGGLIHVIDQAKSNTNLAEEWQQAGLKFCSSNRSTRTSRSSKKVA